ncbi:MAG: hypothetical protein A2161_14290 [Candidatus Schekmanbacteria bacterium RBG_13_48_7]|uniref:CBS domain-containing protein n=1 Tax=Candidatus Schekmanbacteria bacterium RBG_13_48_7 TaxID=1817878 RepID=A0A1F7RV24_9BACT|nr:MAG: hypothetical protein A2161_14290 [Candidatus Schekmanbacteria bacterium RBG_13_48_7]
MDLRAKDFMSREFLTISPNATIHEAIGTMKKAPASIKGRRIFGLMVINENQNLVGMISMYDILYHIRPASIKDDSDSNPLDWEIAFEKALASTKDMRVSNIMTRSVVTITEDTHIMDVIDTMIKKHIRRLPVVEDNKIVGIVYISDVFFEVYKKLL